MRQLAVNYIIVCNTNSISMKHRLQEQSEGKM